MKGPVSDLFPAMLGAESAIGQSAMYTLDDLAETIAQRAGASAEKSYTKSLLDKGAAHCARKFGEEAIELTVAGAALRTKARCAQRPPTCSTICSCSSRARGVPFASVMAELESRTRQSGHQEKASRRN